MNRLYFSVIISFTLIFHNCIESNSTLEIPFEGNKIVAYSFLSPSKPIAIQVTQLQMIKGKPDTSVWLKTAIVKVFENKIFLEQLRYDSAGFYASTRHYRPRKGQLYHFEITAPDFSPVVSEGDTIPWEARNIKNIVFTDSVSLFNYGEVLGNLKIYIDKPKIQPNYYGCKFRIYNHTQNWLTLPTLENAFSGFGGLPCEFAEMNNDLDLGLVFSDKCLQGDNQNINFRFQSLLRYDTIGLKTDSVHVYFHTLSPNTFKFAQSLYLHYASRDLQSVPLPVFSNIKGGYGFVGCYNSDTVSVKLK